MQRRAGRSLALACLFALTLAAGFSRTGRTQSSGAEVLQLINQLRAGYGLPPFQWDANLAVAAQWQADFMASNNIYSHVGRALAAGYNGHATENIVGGSRLTASQGVTWWRNSATHFNTMISDRYIHAGVGVATGHDQNFYTLVVGVPDASVAGSSARNVAAPSDELLAPVAPVMIAAPRVDGSIVHTVGPGQSFWAIAARYEVPLEQLDLFNNLSEESVINPGDVLTIRLAEGQEPPPTPTPPLTHRVREGDSLWTIAAWYNLSLPELLWLNGIQEDSLVSPGDEVRIRLNPGELPPPTATPPLAHVVQAGDTLWGIAVRYGLELDEMLAFNELNQNSVLSIGQVLLIVEPTATPTATIPATPTRLPTATGTPTAIATVTPPAAAKVAFVVEPTPVPQPSPGTSPVAGVVGFVVGAGLVAGALAAIAYLRRSS
jgi:LysM repeat protein